MVGYEPCQKHVRTFSPSMTPKLERLSLTETAHNYRLGERLRLRLMVALLTLVGKCLCRRAKPARFGCHLPVLKGWWITPACALGVELRELSRSAKYRVIGASSYFSTDELERILNRYDAGQGVDAYL